MKQHILKRALSGILAGVLALPCAFAAGESEVPFYRQFSSMISSQDSSSWFNSIELTVNSDTLRTDGREEITTTSLQSAEDNTPMVPVCLVAERTQASASYDAKTNTLEIASAAGNVVRCPIGENYIVVDGKTVPIAHPSYREGDEVYLPASAILEAMSLEVTWNGKTETLSIQAPYQTRQVVAWSEKPLDPAALGAENAVSSGTGLWIFRFRTQGETRQALEKLLSWGVPASPDRVISSESLADREEIPILPAEETGTVAFGEHHSWGVDDCGFDEFRAKYVSGTGQRAVVAVIDSGVDSNHPFLKGRVLPGWDFVDDDGDPSNDGFGHGTHVAGTVIDCCGDAPVDILPVRIFSDNGLLPNSGKSTVSMVAVGIEYAAGQGADIINLSLSGPATDRDVLDLPIESAVSRGAFVVAAAGNWNDDTQFYCPAHITAPGVAVVSAGTSRHQKANFSGYGASVDLMAPGCDISSCVPGGGYKNDSGTSMAAPHVSAAAALLDLAWGKKLSPAELEKQLHTATAYQTWTNAAMGYGFLDLSQAAPPDPAEPEPQQPPETPVLTGYRYNVTSLSLTVGESANVSVTAVYSDGSTKDVTEESLLGSSDSAVASVSGSGLVTGVSAGTARVFLKFLPSFGGGEVPAPIVVTVTSPAVQREHYSWGAADCGFDNFVANHVSPEQTGVVAVIDTGVDASHPLLEGKVLPGYDFVDKDDDASDMHYYGTHCAGVVIDCCGDANVKILPVRVLNKEGFGRPSETLPAIMYAADQGADVICLALGTFRDVNNDAMDAAIQYALDKGCLVVVAAGNDNRDTTDFCPAHLTTPGVVVVSAGTSLHQKMEFSNHGESVDLMAPADKINSSIPNGTYKNLTGTSMATAHAAAAAVLLDMAWGKTLTPGQLEEKLHTATTYQTWADGYTGYGFLDLSRAETPDSPPVSSPSSFSRMELQIGSNVIKVDGRESQMDVEPSILLKLNLL